MPLEYRRPPPVRKKEPEPSRPADNVELSGQSPETTEFNEASVRECVRQLAETGRRFEEALSQYHELLTKQGETEASLQQIETRLKNEQRFAEIKAKAAKLLWATMRYLSSSSIVATGAAAGTYAFTGDAALASLAGASGALTGSAIEYGLTHLEKTHNRADQFYELYPELAPYLSERKRAERKKENESTNRRELTESLQTRLTDLRSQIHSIELEIDSLGSSGFALLPDHTALTAEPEMDEREARKKVQELVEHLQNAGRQLDELLGQYYEMTVLAEGAEAYYAMQKQSYADRELAIKMKVTARQIWKVIKTVHMTLSTGGIVGTFAYTQALQSQHPIAWAVTGTAIGAGMGWLYFKRFEPKVMFNNVPQPGLLDSNMAERVGTNTELQLASDPQLADHRSAMAEAQAAKDILKEQQDRLSRDLDAFIEKYPIKP